MVEEGFSSKKRPYKKRIVGTPTAAMLYKKLSERFYTAVYIH